MAEDAGEKAHAPTAKRLDDARRKGDVAVAADMRHAVMLGAIWLGGSVIAGTGLQLLQFGSGMWQSAGSLRLEAGSGQSFLAWLFAEMLHRLGPLLMLFFVAAIAIGFTQGRPTFAPSRLSLKWSRLNPASGAKRLFGRQGWVEFAKTLLKCGGVALLCWWSLRPLAGGIGQAVGLEPNRLVLLLGQLTLDLLRHVLLLVVVIAAADSIYQHRSFLSRMRMSLQEMKDEQRDSDGDPAVKARQRRVAAERSRRRMMAAVPSAAVVLTNPTHYAVALKYEHGTMSAPLVVAKGADRIALRIRELAAEHDIPILESPPLARALYASADLDRPIPLEYYAAVAEIISFVLRLAKARSRGQALPRWQPGTSS
ncbi:flagellar type III secretion system protein FlhB [Sphingomonas sp. KRR8]|uniref:EscU/YscU/HrcU family type III secretion system export apparatus switch protein n=1 Tax=Sphingomonas sp. KRR8 TaxID=2942996 RepID=UPI0020207807|nr:flagellar type III secretion system protein FlhB [Sphingomonas sp. KRR8]URD61907.1 flagellar type III secretion system protein FlhB [Sphingomonas sp. KRR8]